jgi:hypothetical protein
MVEIHYLYFKLPSRIDGSQVIIEEKKETDNENLQSNQSEVDEKGSINLQIRLCKFEDYKKTQ